MPAGRKPKPTEEKRLRGNPGGRPLNDKEPEAKLYKKLPDPPEWLGPYAKKEWNRAGTVLIEMRLFTDADWGAFAAYCQNLEIMILAMQDIDENGMTIVNQRGQARNPSLTAFASASTTMRALAAEFGMTPSSRSRMKFAGDDDEDGLDDILGEQTKDDTDVE